MAQTAADVLIEILLDSDVEVVFGLPGDGINGIMEALRTRQDRIRFVQVRHEESAPPKITLEQAAKFAQALVRGEPNREKIALTVLRDRVREVV